MTQRSTARTAVQKYHVVRIGRQIQAALDRVVYWSTPADATPSSVSSSCGRDGLRCRNVYRCVQRQGRWGGQCFADLRDLRVPEFGK